jgi:hypothetical protein
MTLTRLERIALGASGATALGIGAFILAAPRTFYASYGISLGDDVDLLSELRAPAAASPPSASSCSPGSGEVRCVMRRWSRP